MNAEQLLQHFERISEAPDATKRLRRFILELAVRGKLVEQDPSEEPAKELLKQIAAEKARLVKAGEIKKQKPLGALPESPFPIPSNWCWSQLAEIGVLSPRNEAPDTLEVSFVPMPLIAADYGVANQHEIRPWAEIKKGYTHFAEGDVGLAKITPCFENGKSSVFRNLTGGIGSGTTELHIVRPLFVNQDYILLFLKSPHFIETGIPKMTGTAGQKRVPTDYFSNSPFPLPPLAEQHRIVAKVDELMFLCDQLDAAKAEREKCRDSLVAASLQRLNQPAEEEETFREQARFTFNNLPRITTRTSHIKQLRQTILNLAVRGKLVEQNPSDETAINFLNRIAAEKVRPRTITKAIKGNEFLAPEGTPFSIPASWEWACFADYALDISTGPFGSALHQSDYVLNGIPLVNPSHMIKDKIRPDPKVSVSNKTAERLEGYRMKEGDIVMARRGEVGRAALVTKKEVGWLCGTGSFFVSFTKEVHRDHILLLLRSELVRSYLSGKAIGTTMTNLNHGILKKMPLPIPPLAEQHRIVAKVDELMAICDQLEAQITATEQDGRRFLESVLADALAPGIGLSAEADVA